MDKYSNHYHIGEHASDDIEPLIHNEDYYLVTDVDKEIAKLEAKVLELEHRLAEEHVGVNDV